MSDTTRAVERSGFSGTQIFFAFLGGAAAGAAAVFLTAPKSGQQMRDKLSEFARAGAEKGKHLPEALQSATKAAGEAFTDALEVSPPRHNRHA